MDNFSTDITDMMREVAEQRDAGLREGLPEISPDRLRRLQAALAREFPVECGLDSIAMRRDASLRTRAPQLPTSVETELAKGLTFTGAFEASELVRLPSPSVQLSRRLVSALAIAAAVIVLIGGAFYFSGSKNPVTAVGVSGKLESPSVRTITTVSSGAASLTDAGDRLFASSGNDLTLRVSKIELASLQPSLLTMNRAILADRRHADRGLPLDLPIREMFIDEATSATP